MKNVHVLPTDKPSRLSIKDGVLHLHRLQWIKGAQNIYITSDEEIKEGDWCYDLYRNQIIQCNENSLDINQANNGGFSDKFGKYSRMWKKIILTDNKDLIKDGVQAIDDDFLEWFVKNPSCGEVEVKSYKLHFGSTLYKIIIPKEEPNYNMKQEIIAEMEKLQELKQETLEEAAEEFANSKKWMDKGVNNWVQHTFVEGAESDAARDYWFSIFKEQFKKK